jgi:hypothetical protein
MEAAGTAIRGAGLHARATLTLVALVCLFSVGLVSGAAATAATPSPPLPGGRYVGETEKRIDRSIKIKVRAAGSRSTSSGYVRYRCGGIKAPFESTDGTFIAEQRGKGGKLRFKATGSFEEMNGVVGAVKRLAKGLRRPGCGPAAFTAALKNAPPIETKTISYGPFDTDPTGGHGGGGGHNVPLGDLEKPCTDCHLVGILPDLREADGSRANFDTGSMLHHVVFSNTTESDSTCPNRNQRIFGAGNERSPIAIPRGYGLPVSAGDDWRLITHIMNMGMHAKPLTIEVTFYYVKGDALIDVTPFWFDIDNCGNSEYMTPAGRHTATWNYEIPPRLDGEIVTIGGHLHDHGEQIKLVNTTRDETICGGMAGYDTDPSYMGHIESVDGCTGRPVARLKAGDAVRLLSRYDAPEPIDDVMGIMFGYLAPSS